jgi:DNA mismatch repair protein MSH4
MAQVGSFVPAQYASFPIIRQLFARVSLDDNIEANVSTFAAEMREAAFILHNIDGQSMAIVDELGRGTSTRDGLAIAIAIAEALIESRALVWFVTHFRDLPKILAERNGVVNLHLAVDNTEDEKMEMLYRVSSGAVEDEHYGLKLARVMPLPPDVIEHAELVSATLDQALQKKKNEGASVVIIIARKRRLLLNLKEHLIQAKNGTMDGEDLTHWLKDLQREFVVRMSALEEEERALRLKGDVLASLGDEPARAVSTADTETSGFDETNTTRAPGTADTTATGTEEVPTTERSNAGSEFDYNGVA